MYSLKNALVCTGWNLYSLRKNPRFYMSLFLGFVLCWMLTDKTMALARTYHTNVQVFEPFIWCFADGDSILYASLVLMLLLAEFPRLDTPASYLICRANRLPWLIGQVLTVLVITLGYCLFLLLSSMALCGGYAIFQNTWSDTATLLSFAPNSFDAAFAVTRKTVKLTLPYTCVIQIFLLLFFYVLLLSLVQLAATVFKSKKTGVGIALLIGLTGFVLTPERFVTWLSLPTEFRYYANLLAAWLSPLQHATYTMHNFGYDLLPRVGVSYGILGGASAVLFLLSAFKMRTYNFSFTGGMNDDT